MWGELVGAARGSRLTGVLAGHPDGLAAAHAIPKMEPCVRFQEGGSEAKA